MKSPDPSFLTGDALDLGALIREIRRDSDGGLAAFLGVVRNENEGRAVARIDYTAYETMAENEMEKIAGELREEFPATRVAMRHRLGILAVGEEQRAVEQVRQAAQRLIDEGYLLAEDLELVVGQASRRYELLAMAPEAIAAND